MDAAKLLTVIAGLDPNDPTTVQEGSPTNYAAGLAPDGLAGRRIGFFTRIGAPVEGLKPADFLDHPKTGLGQVRAALKDAGAEIVLIWDEGLGWTAAGLLEAQKTFRRLKAYRQLPILRNALQEHLRKAQADSAIETIMKAA